MPLAGVLMTPLADSGSCQWSEGNAENKHRRFGRGRENPDLSRLGRIFGRGLKLGSKGRWNEETGHCLLGRENNMDKGVETRTFTVGTGDRAADLEERTHCMVGGRRGQKLGWFRLWRSLNMHQRLKEGFEPDGVCDKGDVLRKSNLMAKYYNEL